ncbi:nicotinate-nicotinamide nucleotide adenylyltransferase [Photobacterium chitinilyticum]|uniref:nicotinate-nucleotide adenylyltransferase n=1 Tax=Photobacterium chitinilyticum TaxID=2485123 RepID=A0A3S3UL13_9GAMM|nr:nicotinate-nicotinamide nucleotide adenylyltransferase [Photobacterium chitinilyticum]RWX54959.1 nicotinate-nicotinamide nucleotide adenylyltransferase [Photobacterium chitinilyticum]
MTTSIAVFGSAFNPPSLGHKSVLERLQRFDRVLLLPSYAHAWGKVMIDYDARCELVEAFIDDLNLPNLELSRLEQEMAVGSEPITTYAVLSKLEEQIPDADITFVVGPDNFLSFAKFYNCQDIVKKWQILACPETVNIRSTNLRDSIVNKRSISHLTTATVARMLDDRARYCFHESNDE